MKSLTRIVVKSALTLHHGVTIRVNESQAALRVNSLKPTGKGGLFQVVHPVQFKIDESFDVDLTQLRKVELQNIEVVVMTLAA